MDALTSLLWILVLFGTVGLTHSVNVNRKLRQFDKRLATLESKTLDTELKLEDVARDIATLNETRCDIQQSPSPDTKLNNPISVQAESSVKHVINRFKLGLKEEKMARKLATENMNAELYEVGNGLKRSAHTELLKVNKTLQSVLDVTAELVSDINEKLEMLPTSVQRNITSTFETKQDAHNKTSTLSQQFEESLSEIRKDVTTTFEESLSEIKKELTTTFEESLLEIRKEVTTTFQQIKDLADNNRAEIRAIAENKRTQCKDKLLSQGAKLHTWRGYTYAVLPKPSSFDDAVVACATGNAHLVHVNSDDEARYIATIFENSQWYWIGLNDRDKEGQWRWHHNNQTPVYSRWQRGEPNNVHNEDCVVTYGSGFWMDTKCNNHFNIICKC